MKTKFGGTEGQKPDGKTHRTEPNTIHRQRISNDDSMTDHKSASIRHACEKPIGFDMISAASFEPFPFR